MVQYQWFGSPRPDFTVKIYRVGDSSSQIYEGTTNEAGQFTGFTDT